MMWVVTEVSIYLINTSVRTMVWVSEHRGYHNDKIQIRWILLSQEHIWLYVYW